MKLRCHEEIYRALSTEFASLPLHNYAKHLGVTQ